MLDFPLCDDDTQPIYPIQEPPIDPEVDTLPLELDTEYGDPDPVLPDERSEEWLF